MTNQALILTLDEAADWAARLRAAGETVVFTNGCFDLLHRGHIDYLQRARCLGNRLFVGLNNDESVRRLKGPGRPLMLAEDRAAVLAELRSVNAIISFAGPTAESLVRAIRPAIYAKGGDWGAGRRIPPEAEIVTADGGRVIYLPFLAGRSTTELLTQIRALPK